MRTVLLGIVMSFFLVVNIGEAYEEINVTNGGSVKGIIKIGSTAPVDPDITINSNNDICGSAQKADKYIINDSKVKNVVVWLDRVQKGKKITKETYKITINKCRISPLVGIAFTGDEFSFKNGDAALHTLQLKSGLNFQRKLSSRPLQNGATIINVALPIPDIEIKKTIEPYYSISPERGYITIMSNTNSFMRGYVFVFDHPYAALTDVDGSFVIRDIPAGNYTLKIWHEGLGIMEKSVIIKPNIISDADFIY